MQRDQMPISASESNMDVRPTVELGVGLCSGVKPAVIPFEEYQHLARLLKHFGMNQLDAESHGCIDISVKGIFYSNKPPIVGLEEYIERLITYAVHDVAVFTNVFISMVSPPHNESGAQSASDVFTCVIRKLITNHTMPDGTSCPQPNRLLLYFVTTCLVCSTLCVQTRPKPISTAARLRLPRHKLDRLILCGFLSLLLSRTSFQCSAPSRQRGEKECRSDRRTSMIRHPDMSLLPELPCLSLPINVMDLQALEEGYSTPVSSVASESDDG